MTDQYYATVRYERKINHLELHTLNHLAELYQGHEYLSNVNSGLISFAFDDEKNRELFVKGSKQLKDVADVRTGKVR